jgi:RimJ/RimL family protein N-acetyltransferase
MMQFEVAPFQMSVTEIRDGDQSAYLKHFQEREIHERTLRIPFPYTERDAEQWMDYARNRCDEMGRPRQFAIRDGAGRLVGGIGLIESELAERSHQAEIGYWLAKPLWGRGIMTECVRTLSAYSLGELGYTRLTATVLSWNIASARVLEKNGYVLEALLRNHYRVGGSYFDGKLYALVQH